MLQARRSSDPPSSTSPVWIEPSPNGVASSLPAGSPPITFETHNVPCATNPLGVKGAGEAGAIGSCPAVMNAIIDALWREYRIDHIDMPATAERVWMTIEAARRQHRL